MVSSLRRFRGRQSTLRQDDLPQTQPGARACGRRLSLPTRTGRSRRWRRAREGLSGDRVLADVLDLHELLPHLRDVLGHKDIATTALYLHAVDERKRAAADAVGLIGGR